MTDLRRPVLDFIAPGLIFDLDYKFIDWNPAFDEIVAKPKGLRLGMNIQEIFSLPQSDEVDCGTWDFLTPAFGKVRFQKLATPLIDDTGAQRAWILALNILRADDSEGLWKAISTRLSDELLWSIYGSGLDHLWSTHKDYQEALNRLSRYAKGSEHCLELGAGMGNLTLRLLSSSVPFELTTIESNQAMLEAAKRKILDTYLVDDLSEVEKLSFLKGSLDRMEWVGEQRFDTIVSFDGIHRMADPETGLLFFDRLLRPGGKLAFACWHPGTEPERHFETLKNHLVSIGRWEESEQSFQAFEKAYGKLLTSQMHHDRAYYTKIVEELDFEIEHIDEDLCDGNLLMFSARKK